MSDDIIKKFIINMYARKVPIKEIASTTNKTKGEVIKIISESKKQVSQAETRIHNQKNNVVFIQNNEDTNQKKQIENQLLDSQKEKSVNKTVKNLLEIKRKIMLGEEYNEELLKKIKNKIIKKKYSKPILYEVSELAQIYVQLGRFTNAKAIVRDVYDGSMNKKDPNKIMDIIKKQELSYNVMKYYKEGMSAGQIAKKLGFYTVDAIREINKQKDLNIKIKRMHKEGKSDVDIAELFHENIDRVKWGIDSKETPEKEWDESR